MEALLAILLVVSLIINGLLLTKKLPKMGKLNKASDSFVLAAAYGRLSEAEYANLKTNPAPLIRAIEEIKGNRMTEIQFMREQYQACLDGIKHAEKEHLRHTKSSLLVLAREDMKERQQLEEQAADIARKLGMYDTAELQPN